MLPPILFEQIKTCIQSDKKITFLVGAGISADSGIPTFRGKEGYWTIGSKNYHPQEMATNKMFQVKPKEVWKWYLYRKSIVEKAEPNPSHYFLKELEILLKDSYTLITQTVDGLHKRAGSSPDTLFAIHGDLSYVRCSKSCTQTLHLFPSGIDLKERNPEIITDKEWNLLHCSCCGGLLRPHVLWFDEYYDEDYYKYDSAMKIAQKTGLLFILGTSGATNLPVRIAEEVIYNQGFVVEVNLDESYFSHLLLHTTKGLILREKSSLFLEKLINELQKLSLI